MLRLTHKDGHDVWLSVLHVLFIRSYSEEGGSVIELTSGSHVFVRENPTQVAALVNSKMRDQ